MRTLVLAVVAFFCLTTTLSAQQLVDDRLYLQPDHIEEIALDRKASFSFSRRPPDTEISATTIWRRQEWKRRITETDRAYPYLYARIKPFEKPEDVFLFPRVHSFVEIKGVFAFTESPDKGILTCVDVQHVGGDTFMLLLPPQAKEHPVIVFVDVQVKYDTPVSFFQRMKDIDAWGLQFQISNSKTRE